MNLVLTIAIGDVHQRFAGITHPSIKTYADRIGADFLPIAETKVSKTTPHYEKFQIYELLNRYERIIYLDTDLIVRSDCPDLFKIVSPDRFGAFNEGAFTDRSLTMAYGRDEYKIPLRKWNGRYYNTGVMVVSRKHKQLFRVPENQKPIFYEQTWLNLMLVQSETETHQLPYRFNRMTVMDGFTGEERHASYIVHYAGAPDMEAAIVLARKDLAKWQKDGPQYRYRRHILIDVQGGLGDQMQAEPTIRYLRKNVYPDEDVRVITHFPELFRHLQLPVFRHGEMKCEPDCPYWHRVTLPGPDTPMWLYVSNLLCHTVDFISMAVLRRTLPDEDKEYKLEVCDDDVKQAIQAVGREDLENLILVHPGRHWENKTFPAYWWQQILDGLVDAGETPCIIGKSDDTRGTVPIKIREGMIDSRELLDLHGLIAFISKAKVLVSNDSAPVHLAGAFNNWIVLIPTCKHPDHILPWRKGSKRHKAVAPYKRLILDDIPSEPTIVHGQSAEKVPGAWDQYLPDPQTVINAVISAQK